MLIFAGGKIMTELRPIDGFKIRRFSEGKRSGIFVIYMVEGSSYTRSKFYDVDEEKIKKIREVLSDYTETNRKASELCQTIGLVTILSKVSDIVWE